MLRYNIIGVMKTPRKPYGSPGRKLALPARFERATFRLGGGRSILLSYGDIYQQLFYLIFEKESITLCGRDEIYLGDGAGY